MPASRQQFPQRYHPCGIGRPARYASGLFPLIGDGGHQPGNLVGVAQEMIPRVVEALVELEDIRHGGREVELRNRLVRNAFQVLDDAAHRRPGTAAPRF